MDMTGSARSGRDIRSSGIEPSDQFMPETQSRPAIVVRRRHVTFPTPYVCRCTRDARACWNRLLSPRFSRPGRGRSSTRRGTGFRLTLRSRSSLLPARLADGPFFPRPRSGPAVLVSGGANERLADVHRIRVRPPSSRLVNMIFQYECGSPPPVRMFMGWRAEASSQDVPRRPASAVESRHG